MDREEKIARRRWIVRIVSLFIFLGIIGFITVLVFPYVKDMKSASGREQIIEMFDRFDTFWSVVLFIIIQAVQVIIAVIPPIQIVGGMMFGWLFGAIFSFAGIMLGTLAIFMLVRFLGRPLVEAFVSNKHLEKFGFLQDEEKLLKVLIILYIIPGVPKDVLSYIVPLTKVDKRDFFMFVMPFRLPAVIMSTVLGQSIMTGSYVLAFVMVGVFIVIAVLGFIFRDKIISGFRSRKHHTEK